MSMGNVAESIRPIESSWGRAASGCLAVARYEILRSLTLWRISLWLAMILFPVALVAMVSYNVYRDGREPPEPGLVFTMILFILVPEVVTVLGMLLWATPIVSSELEGQTWIYSLVRPGGRRSVLLGKYLVAVLWTASCGILAVSLAIPWTGIKNPTETWLVLATLCGLSSIAHGALFSLLGVLFQRRVMVIAFVYAILVEAVLGWIPAVINKFTAAYHLRSLLFQWLDFPITEPLRSSQLVSDGTPAWVHVTCLLGGAAVLLAVSCWRISRCQYTWQSDV